MGDGLSNHPRCLDAGFHNLVAIGGCVSAVDAAAGEVDYNMCAIDFREPRARIATIPFDSAPGTRALMPTQDGYGVALFVKMPRESLADLATATGNDNAESWFHRFLLC